MISRMERPGVLSRRRVLQGAGALAVAAAALEMAGPLSRVPDRTTTTNTTTTAAGAGPDIQFDIAALLAAPPQTSGTGVVFQMPPVHTVFVTGRLERAPTPADQAMLASALARLEAAYPFGAAGLLTFVSYGIPYFRRLPGGLAGRLVSSRMPRLLPDRRRYALEEAAPGPTDVSPGHPGPAKLRYQVPVVIESNDMLLTLRSDHAPVLSDALAWLGGSNVLRGRAAVSPALRGLLHFTSSRHMFTQIGLPRAVADRNGLPYARYIQPESPMWMGFSDQQVGASGPAAICTFAGNSSARLTDAVTGDYFDNGSIQHLSHDILDMLQYHDMASAASVPGADGTFVQRVQYVFHAPEIAAGDAGQFVNGGGPAFLPNANRGPGYARRTAQGIGTNVDFRTGQREHRMGHLSCLQRSSRAADGTPVHIRMDGPGFDAMDVPDGSRQPKLQFTIFVPSADFFSRLRVSQASLDLQARFGVTPKDNGLERFITATRRQNFLCPPRRHRAFPLCEFT
jgi:hypothetical protein